jgi:hypothetical protein
MRWSPHKKDVDAIDWLKADLTAWSQRLGSDPEKVGPMVVRLLSRWTDNPDLADIRDEPSLEKLPEDERKAWQAFWAEVVALLKKASES